MEAAEHGVVEIVGAGVVAGVVAAPRPRPGLLVPRVAGVAGQPRAAVTADHQLAGLQCGVRC